jgi:hypothetical protein
MPLCRNLARAVTDTDATNVGTINIVGFEERASPYGNNTVAVRAVSMPLLAVVAGRQGF